MQPSHNEGGGGLDPGKAQLCRGWWVQGMYSSLIEGSGRAPMGGGGVHPR
jgi:hypothetical protein